MAIDVTVVSTVANPFTRLTSTATVSAMTPSNGSVGQSEVVQLIVDIIGIPDFNDTWVILDINGTSEPVYYNTAFAAGWTGSAVNISGTYRITANRVALAPFAATMEWAAYDLGVEIGNSLYHTKLDPEYTSFWNKAYLIESYLTSSIPGFTKMSEFCAAMLTACGSGTLAIQQKRLNELAYITELGELIAPRFKSTGMTMTGPFKSTSLGVSNILTAADANRHLYDLGVQELEVAGVSSSLIRFLNSHVDGPSPQHKLSAMSVAIQYAAIIGNNLA